MGVEPKPAKEHTPWCVLCGLRFEGHSEIPDHTCARPVGSIFYLFSGPCRVCSFLWKDHIGSDAICPIAPKYTPP